MYHGCNSNKASLIHTGKNQITVGRWNSTVGHCPKDYDRSFMALLNGATKMVQ